MSGKKRPSQPFVLFTRPAAVGKFRNPWANIFHAVERVVGRPDHTLHSRVVVICSRDHRATPVSTPGVSQCNEAAVLISTLGHSFSPPTFLGYHRRLALMASVIELNPASEAFVANRTTSLGAWVRNCFPSVHINKSELAFEGAVRIFGLDTAGRRALPSWDIFQVREVSGRPWEVRVL